jgi:hypothetical protein
MSFRDISMSFRDISGHSPTSSGSLDPWQEGRARRQCAMRLAATLKTLTAGKTSRSHQGVKLLTQRNPPEKRGGFFASSKTRLAADLRRWSQIQKEMGRHRYLHARRALKDRAKARIAERLSRPKWPPLLRACITASCRVVILSSLRSSLWSHTDVVTRKSFPPDEALNASIRPRGSSVWIPSRGCLGVVIASLVAYL